jgi:integrase
MKASRHIAPNPAPNRLARGRSQLGLTPGKSGWYKTMDGLTRWIASYNVAPTADLADQVFLRKFKHWQAAPRGESSITLAWAINDVLAMKKNEVTFRTWEDWRQVLQTFERFIGSGRPLWQIGPDDFTGFLATFADTGPHRRQKVVNVVRAAFRVWAGEDCEYIDLPKFGKGFKPPRAREMRLHRDATRGRWFTPKQIHTLITASDATWAALIWIGINTGIGPTDAAALRGRNLAGDMLTYSRSKNGSSCIAPLWPETIAAIETVRSGDVLIPTGGSVVNRRWWAQFNQLCRSCDVPAIGFYSLRRTWKTVTDELPDRPAVNAVVGHDRLSSMDSVYRQHLSPSRLVAVTEFVRGWLVS